MADSQRRLYRVSIPIRNRTLAEWLKGPRCRELVEARTAELFAVYESMLPVRTERLERLPAPGRLKRGAYYRIGRGGWGAEKDRWFGWVGNTAPYATTIEWGSPSRNIEGQHHLKNAAALLGYGREREFSGQNKKGDAANLRKNPPKGNELTPQERRRLKAQDNKEGRAEARAKAQRNRELREANKGKKRPKTADEKKRAAEVQASNKANQRARAERKKSTQKLTRSEQIAARKVDPLFSEAEQFSNVADLDKLAAALGQEKAKELDDLVERYYSDPKSLTRAQRTELKNQGF